MFSENTIDDRYSFVLAGSLEVHKKPERTQDQRTSDKGDIPGSVTPCSVCREKEGGETFRVWCSCSQASIAMVGPALLAMAEHLPPSGK